ncbi:MAG: aquaporin [Candidatus Bathyarchaeia archaeon]
MVVDHATVAESTTKSPYVPSLNAIKFSKLRVAIRIPTSFNPARSIGPALSSGHWRNIIVYLLGPFLGAIFAGVPFRLLHIEGLQEHEPPPRKKAQF